MLDGHMPWDEREYRREYMRRWRAKNPEKARENTRLGLRRMRARDPERYRKYMRDWRASHPGRHNEINHKSLLKFRLQVLQHYGGTPPKCACCEFSNIDYLEIDHIDGGGSRHSKSIRPMPL